VLKHLQMAEPIGLLSLLTGGALTLRQAHPLLDCPPAAADAVESLQLHLMFWCLLHGCSTPLGLAALVAAAAAAESAAGESAAV
jgi:hypothetical protein